jgi:hypothetical protein
VEGFDSSIYSAKLRKEEDNVLYLVIILVSQCSEVVRAVITDVPQVFDLTLVTGLNPFHLLGTVVLDSVDLPYTIVVTQLHNPNSHLELQHSGLIF